MNSTVRSARRNVRNVVHNYSEVQVKVREATSNDPWGPSTALMSQIADSTHNIIAFTDVMQIVWRRLNDHGRNWRHVLKALVLLDYLVKTGNERVAQQCIENIFAIETLRDFQYYEDGIDHGRGVRDRSNQLVTILKDEERLASERDKAIKARERFAQSGGGFGRTGSQTTSNPIESSYSDQTDGRSSSQKNTGGSGSGEDAVASSDVELARPQTAGEEQLQLQLALAMSKEEAEQERQLGARDDTRLKMALQVSASSDDGAASQPQSAGRTSAIDDLLSLDLAPPPSTSTALHVQVPGVNTSVPRLSAPQQQTGLDAWGLGGSGSVGTLAPSSQPAIDPWAPKAAVQQQQHSMPSRAASVPLSAVAQPFGGVMLGSSEAPPPLLDPWAPMGLAAVGSSGVGLNNGALTDASVSSLPDVGGATVSVDPWAPVSAAGVASVAATSDPWAAPQQQHGTPAAGPHNPPPGNTELDEFALLMNRQTVNDGSAGGGTPWDLTGMDGSLAPASAPHSVFPPPVLSGTLPPTLFAESKSPRGFLGENSKLVNLDNLIGPPGAKPANQAQVNPFALGAGSAASGGNPFFMQQPSPTINQMRGQKLDPIPPVLDGQQLQQSAPDPWMTQQLPTAASCTSPSSNPFLL